MDKFLSSAGEDAAVSVQPASAPRGAAWAGLASAERLAPLRTLLERSRAAREALAGPTAGVNYVESSFRHH